MNIFITGGAGVIGSHLTDSLSSQVHGNASSPPDYLSREAGFVLGRVFNIGGTPSNAVSLLEFPGLLGHLAGWSPSVSVRDGTGRLAERLRSWVPAPFSGVEVPEKEKA